MNMDSCACIFCDSEYGDPLQPYHIEKVAIICQIPFSRDRLLNKKMCMRCKINMDLIESAYRLRDVMVVTLNAKLAAGTQMAHQNVPGVGNADNGVRIHRDDTYALPKLEHEFAMRCFPNPHPTGPPLPNSTVQSTVHQSVSMSTQASAHTLIPVPVATSTHASMVHTPALTPAQPTVTSVKEELANTPQSLMNGAGRFGFPVHHNGVYSGRGGANPSPNPRTNGRRIPNCHKCKISLKTRPYYDAIKHINRCNGQGIRPGRPSTTPRPDVYPCHTCGRKLATREAHELHINKCDGSINHARGRKPADNTCMLCNENLVYRHILKKHLRQEHGINAQRLDDSVLAALKTGSGTGCNVKEQVLSRIQQKMIKDMYESERMNGEGELCDNQINEDSNSQNVTEGGGSISGGEHVLNGSSTNVDEDDAVENKIPPIYLAPEKRNRRKVKPSKYVPEVFTCELCTKQFEYQSQYTQHCCFKIQRDEDCAPEQLTGMDGDDAAGETFMEPVAVDSPEPLDANLIETYTAMEVENGLANMASV